MQNNEAPSLLMDDAMREVCTLASTRNVKLLPSAEENNTLPSYMDWTNNLQRVFNKSDNNAVLYTTYQTYLKSTPIVLSQHLDDARANDYTLGVKLVRGAYLHSEERHLIHDNIADTHNAFDSITAALLNRAYTRPLVPANNKPTTSFPSINLFLATHNAASVRSAMHIRSTQAAQDTPLVPLAYGQLQGMADEVSCELLQAGRSATQAAQAQAQTQGLEKDSQSRQTIDVPRVFKCTAWGSMTECLGYLLRRAAENKDAATRTRESRRAMGAEIWRRCKASVGLA